MEETLRLAVAAVVAAQIQDTVEMVDLQNLAAVAVELVLVYPMDHWEPEGLAAVAVELLVLMEMEVLLLEA